MADPGSVAYLFQRKGVVIVGKEQGTQQLSEDQLMEIALEAGADEINDLGAAFEIVSEPSAMVGIRSAIEAAKLEYESAEVSLLPSMSIPLDRVGAEKIFALIEAIEELDDVQNVYANFDVSDEILATLS